MLAPPSVTVATKPLLVTSLSLASASMRANAQSPFQLLMLGAGDPRCWKDRLTPGAMPGQRSSTP